MHLHPLPGKFVTIPYVLCLFIIAITVLSGMFNHVCMFLYLLPNFWWLITICVFWIDNSLTFPMLMVDKGILHAYYLIFIL